MDRKSAESMMRKDPEAFVRDFLSLQSARSSMSERLARDSQTMAMQRMRIEELSSAISKKDSAIAGKEDDLSKQTEIISQKDTVISEQKKEIEALRKRVTELEEQARLAHAVRYKPSTERIDYCLPGLEDLFKAPGEEEKREGKEAESEPKAKRVTRPRKPRKSATLPSGTAICEIDHTTGLPERKVIGGIPYTLGKEAVDKVSLIPARRIIERHLYPLYTADAEVREGDRRLVVMKSPETDGLACSPSLAAHIAVSKLDDHIPLYRQEEMTARDGFGLSRQTMALWVMRFAKAIEPMRDAFKNAVYSSACLYKDETPVEVLGVRTGSGTVARDSFMYVTVGSTYSEEENRFRRLVLVEYIHHRNTGNLLSDLDSYGYKGPVITDGLKGYNGISVHGTCWVHAIRRFKNVLKAYPKQGDALEACRIAGRIFASDKYPRRAMLEGKIGRDAFMRIRKKASMAHIARLFSFCSSIAGKYAPSSAMGKAISYLNGYSAALYTYLDYAEAEPSNNVCERVCKTFAVGRKNWLFFNTKESAECSSFLLSLIETAKLCGLSSRDYMEYVLTFAPGCRTKDEWSSLLPWNADLSRLAPLKEKRENAKPDPSRTKPYILSGLTGQTVIMPEQP